MTWKPEHNPEVVFRRLAGGEAVLLHLASGAYHELNPTGVMVWELVDGESDVETVAAGVRERTSGAPEDLDERLTLFIDGLRVRDLIR